MSSLRVQGTWLALLIVIRICCIAGEERRWRYLCMPSWSNRLGNELSQLEVALVHAFRVEADGLRLPPGKSHLASNNILKLPPEIWLVPTGAAGPGSGPAECILCRCCGDFSDLQYSCGRVSPDERQRVSTNHLQPLIQPCPATFPVDSGCDEQVVMHMRSGDIMLQSVESGWYPQPPCSYFGAVLDRGFSGRPFGCAVIVTEADRRNPCIAYMQQRSGIKVSVRSSSVREDACLMIKSRYIALSFGSWGPALTRLNAALLHLFIPFGEEAGAKYSGMLGHPNRSELGGGSARHFDGWAASWSHSTVLQGASRHVQTLFSFPGYVTKWESWEDRVHKMSQFPQSNLVERVIAAKHVTTSFFVEEGHRSQTCGNSSEGACNKPKEQLSGPAGEGNGSRTKPVQTSSGSAAQQQGSDDLSFNDTLGSSTAAAKNKKVFCIQREGEAGHQLEVCVAQLDSSLQMHFYAKGILVLSLVGLEASGELLGFTRPRLLPEASQLEVSALHVDTRGQSRRHGRLVSGSAGGVFRIFARIERGGLVHVGVDGGWAPGAAVHALLLHFDFCSAGKHLYKNLPNLHHRSEAVASDHFFRSPLVAVVTEGGGAAIIPDLDILHASRLLPHALDLRSEGSRPRMSYGMVASELEPHMYAVATNRSVVTDRVLASETHLLAAQILLQAPGKPAGLLRKATQYLWERYGQRHLYGDSLPQTLPFEQYGYRYAYAAHLSQLAVRVGQGLWGIDNPVRDGINYDTWENDAMIALGIQHYGEKAKQPALLQVADGMWRLGLLAPSVRGAYPSVFNPRRGGWQPMVKILGHDREVLNCSAEEHFSIPAMAVTMWHYLYLLELFPKTPHKASVLSRLAGLVELLTAIQLPSGSFPHWIKVQTLEPCQQLEESAATSAAGAVLAKAASWLPQKAKAARGAALRAARFVEEHVLPHQNFSDFETYFSCSTKSPGWKDNISGILPQNTLSMQWTADMFLALHKLTNQRHWLEQGEYVMTMLALYQQVWSPPYFREDAYMFGGFGVMNTDAEWSDGRAHRFVFTYVDYYQQTGNWEYLERGLAAARAGFTNMHIPENQLFRVSQVNGPWEPENLEHFSEQDKGQWTGFTWGSGGALAATAYMERRLGGAWLDPEQHRALGLDGVSVDLLPSTTAGVLRVRLLSQLPPGAFQEGRTLLLRGKQEGPVQLEVNGEQRGEQRLASGISVEVPPMTLSGGARPRAQTGSQWQLSDDELRGYIAHGYLLRRPQLPASVHRTIIAKTEMLRKETPRGETEKEGNNILPYVPELLEVFESPEVAGALESILGKDYVMHAHRHAHLNENTKAAQKTHQDSFFGLQSFRPHELQWAMALYFPQETSLEMGPTAVAPGSQYSSLELRFRYNGEGDFVSRDYKRKIGSLFPLCVSQGSVLIMHYDLYHAASRRLSHVLPRWMYKFQFYRLRPPHPGTGLPHPLPWQAPPPPDTSATCEGLRRWESPPADLTHYRTPVWRAVWTWLQGGLPDKAAPGLAGAPQSGSMGERKQGLQGLPGLPESRLHNHVQGPEDAAAEEASESFGGAGELLSVLHLESAPEAQLQWAAYRLAEAGDQHSLLQALLFVPGPASRRAAVHGLIAVSRYGADVGQRLLEVLQGRWREREWMLRTFGLCCAHGPEHDLSFAAITVLGRLRLGDPACEAALDALVVSLQSDMPRNAAAKGLFEHERAACMQEHGEYRLCEGGPPPLRAAAAEGLGRLGQKAPQKALQALLWAIKDYTQRAPQIRNLEDFDDARVVMAAARSLAALLADDRLAPDVVQKEGLAEALQKVAVVLSTPELTSELRGQPKDLRRYALAEVLEAISWLGNPALSGAALQLATRRRPQRFQGVREPPASIPDGQSLRRYLRLRVCSHTAVGTPW